MAYPVLLKKPIIFRWYRIPAKRFSGCWLLAAFSGRGEGKRGK